MTHIDIRPPNDFPRPEMDFRQASLLATEAARENWMQEPTILSWHRHSTQGMSPFFDGANPNTWWEKYGEGNGGSLEINVGGEYDFVLMDSVDYETLGDMPLRNLGDDQGNLFVCYTRLLGNSSTPSQEACMPLDDWWADQY
jgi:hypothetical protein